MAAQTKGGIAAVVIQLCKDEFEDIVLNIISLSWGQFNHSG
jgi:hypothetical protein